MTRVAVLGATGAIGGRFVEVVAGQERAPVRVVVHRVTRLARVLRYPIEVTDHPGALVGAAAVASFVDGPDASPDAADALVEHCAEAGIERLVHLGCTSSFGAIRTGRLTEDEAPPRPPHEAAARRWAFEEALLATGRAHGLDVVVVTVPLVYGPFTLQGAHQPFAAVQVGRVALAASSGRCHLVYVDDVVEAVWAALHAPGPVSGRLFATGPEPTTWADLYERFGAMVGRPGAAVLADGELDALLAQAAGGSQLRWPDPLPLVRRLPAIATRYRVAALRPPARRRLLLPDPEERAERAVDVEIPSSRTASVLGWSPVVRLDEGMRRTAAYLRWSDYLST